jgi:hypothetical protein
MGVGTDLWNQYERLLIEQDLDGVMSRFTSDAVYAGPTWRQEGTEAIRAFFDGYFRAFTDSKLDTSLLIEERDRVVGEWTGWDTQSGPFVMPDGTEVPALPVGRKDGRPSEPGARKGERRFLTSVSRHRS